MAEKIELHPQYYLHNFYELLQFLEQHAQHLLSARDKAFLASFYTLPEGAKCLFLRLMNRRGQYFRLEKLQYPEVGETAEVIQLLIQNGMAAWATSEDTTEALLQLFTKPELLKLLKSSAVVLPRASTLKKPELLQAISALGEDADLLKTQLLADHPIVKQAHGGMTTWLLFLYFGELESDMSRFVVRDVGHLKYQSVDPGAYKAIFSSRKEAEQKLQAYLHYEVFRELRELAEAGSIYVFCAQTLPLIQEVEDAAQGIYERMALKAGAILERLGYDEESIEVYSFTDLPPSRERRVRLLTKKGETEQALQLCEQMVAQPQTAEEAIFAQDFSLRLQGGRQIKAARALQKKAKSIAISNSFQYRVEEGTLQYFLEDGYEGFITENYLWRNLVGLLFWDIMFEGQLNRPLQIVPTALFTHQFYQRQHPQLTKRLALMDRPKEAYNFIQNQFEANYGMVNPFVGWHELTLPSIALLLQNADGKAVAKVLDRITQNLKANLRGFPDLMLCKERNIQFLEIKSPTDSLSDHQLFWIGFMNKAGLQAEVLNVGWLPE